MLDLAQTLASAGESIAPRSSGSIPAAMSASTTTDLSIARAPRPHMTGLIARDAGITARLADGADLAAGEGDGSGVGRNGMQEAAVRTRMTECPGMNVRCRIRRRV